MIERRDKEPTRAAERGTAPGASRGRLVGAPRGSKPRRQKGW